MTKHRRKITPEADTAKLAAQMEHDLSAIRRAMRKPLESEFAKGELTLPQKAVMQAVVKAQGISLKDLSREVSLAHSTVSGIVDRLEKRGFLERRPDPADGRISRIQTSRPVAEFLRNQMPALVTGPLVSALQHASEAERTMLARALQRLRELLGAE
jgi:DNA-binding MarR family transcriptional regulator